MNLSSHMIVSMPRCANLREPDVKTPRWVWILLLALALTPVWKYAATEAFIPEGYVSTGASTGDAPILISCMRMFETSFFSPWSSAQSPYGPHSVRYFAAAYYWIYGILGWLLSPFPLSWPLKFEVVNTLGLLFYLWTAWRFLRSFFPDVAVKALALFTLGGGLGGLVFFLFRLFALHETPAYESLFLRYALYELLEGAHVPPLALAWRLYYTLPLGLFLAALLLAKPDASGLRIPSKAILAAGSLFLSGWINMRVGAGSTALLVLFAWLCVTQTPLRIKSVFFLILASSLGVLTGLLMQRMNPVMAEGCFDFIRMGVWPTALLSAVLPCAILAAFAVPNILSESGRPVQYFAGAAFGFITLYAALFAAYYVYFGVNPLEGSDFSATIRVSDPALLGAPLGLLSAWLWIRRRPARTAPVSNPENAWILLWLILVVSVGISAFGQGWFLRLVPHRALVFLALPLSICAAQGLTLLERSHRKTAATLFALIVIAGIASKAVMIGWFHAPLGYVENGPFHWSHSELMRAEERPLLDSVGPGMILAPSSQGPCMGDILAMRDNVRVVYGFGSLSISDVIMNKSGEDATLFFEDDCPDEKRVEIIQRRGVDYVYCPATHPVAETVRQHLLSLPWLVREAASGDGCILRVDRSRI